MEKMGKRRDLSVRRVTNAQRKLSKLVDWDWSGVKHKRRSGIIGKGENTLEVSKIYL